MMLEKVPPGLRGELTRWLIEPHAGVFVGGVSAMVREKLWEKLTNECKDGNAMMVFPAQNEQGFTIRTHGETRRDVWEYEGLQLIRCPSSG